MVLEVIQQQALAEAVPEELVLHVVLEQEDILAEEHEIMQQEQLMVAMEESVLDVVECIGAEEDISLGPQEEIQVE